MSYYVRRIRHDGKVGWTGPIRSLRQAGKESLAWRNAGWSATVEPSTPAVRAEIRAWEQQMKRERTP